MEKTLAQLTARDIMSRQVVSIGPNDTIQEAITLLQENLLSTLPVTNTAGKVVGVISARDILDWTEELDDGSAELLEVSDYYRDWVMRQAGEEGKAVKVAELMNDRVVTVAQDAPLAEVLSVLLRNGIHHLPVTDPKQRMAGFVSTTDVLKVVAQSITELSAI